VVALTAFALGAAGQVIPGRLFRHAVGAAFRQSGTGLQVVSGVLAGAPNTQGELALVSNTQLTVQPFRAVIQNSQDLTAGAYLVPSETAQTFTAGGAAGQTIPAQDASQFRRALVTLHVDDAQVAGSGGNASTLEVLPGALAATAGAAVLPATPANALNLGELLIPPTGQTVTLTPYNPRTGIRHAIVPVIADTSTVVGHGAAQGSHDGQYRDAPLGQAPTVGAGGPQRWNGSLLRWDPVSPVDFPFARLRQTTAVGPFSASTWVDMPMQGEDFDSHNGHDLVTNNSRWYCPAGQGGLYAVEANVSFGAFGAGGYIVAARIAKNASEINGAQSHTSNLNAGGGPQQATGRHLVQVAPGDYLYVQGYTSAGGWSTSVGAAGNLGVATTLTIERVR
jgi:hypothetical protein